MTEKTEGIWISISVWTTRPTHFVLWLVDMDKFWRPLFLWLYRSGRLHAWLQLDSWEKERLDLRDVHYSWWGRFSEIGCDVA